MTRREAQDTREAALGMRDEQAAFGLGGAGVEARGDERGEIVFEDERPFIRRIARATRARVAGTEIATRIVGRPLLARARLALTLPRTLRPLRRDEDPLT